ncbi:MULTISPECIES: response regulator [Deinococcus]|uniref:response regulator n=1 Tax=Deinococcus TaxID=1298 RepID=UPI00166B52A1|nr:MULTISPECIES: response regulator [Deinococcus]MDK2014687.1 response regulator [Deinococcus sp. 43]
MVIDDDETERILLQELTLDLAVEWVLCRGSADAWTYLQTHPRQLPHVILVDWHLAGEQGLDWVRRVRTTPEFTTLVVLMRSGALSDEQVRDAYLAGASAVLIKPMTLPDLDAQLTALVAFYHHTASRLTA